MTILRHDSKAAAVPGFVEHPAGTTVLCSTMRDSGLAQLIAASNDIVVVAPECREPTPTMRRMSEQLAKIHREALQGHIQGKSNVALAFERIDLLLDDNRDVLVGAARRNPGTEAERSVAVICLAPSDIKSCNLTIKLDD